MPSPGGESVPADPSHLVGRQILGYHIQAVLARARTGVVYRAMERQKNREVAFKAFYPTVFQDLTAAQRFTRAVNTMLPIQHENLVRLYAAGRAQGLCYTASELVDGQSAAQMIQDIGISGMMPWQYALRIAAHMARALQVAEQHGIVHRNVTPRNILIRQADGVAKLGDLIFAKALEGLSADIEVTRPGELVGDLSYMSPEQTGAGGPVDCRSDIYCLGATLYALLTGRPPLEGRIAAHRVRLPRMRNRQLGVPVPLVVRRNPVDFAVAAPGIAGGRLRHRRGSLGATGSLARPAPVWVGSAALPGCRPPAGDGVGAWATALGGE